MMFEVLFWMLVDESLTCKVVSVACPKIRLFLPMEAAVFFAQNRRAGDDVLTPYTPSVLVSKNGKVATAPVLATTDADAASGSPTSTRRSGC